MQVHNEVQNLYVLNIMYFQTYIPNLLIPIVKERRHLISIYHINDTYLEYFIAQHWSIMLFQLFLSNAELIVTNGALE